MVIDQSAKKNYKMVTSFNKSNIRVIMRENKGRKISDMIFILSYTYFVKKTNETEHCTIFLKKQH